jgi:hypothetical protein
MILVTNVTVLVYLSIDFKKCSSMMYQKENKYYNPNLRTWKLSSHYIHAYRYKCNHNIGLVKRK